LNKREGNRCTLEKQQTKAKQKQKPKRQADPKKTKAIRINDLKKKAMIICDRIEQVRESCNSCNLEPHH
jgi:hypothetical protein